MSNRILDSDKTKEQLIAELEALRASQKVLQQQVTIQSAQLEKLKERTAQTLAEEALKKSEEQLRLALEAAQMGAWDWDILNNCIIASSRCEQLFGLEPGTFDGAYETFEAFLHPDDRDAVNQAVNRAIAERTDYHHEYRTVWSDGSIRWIEGKGRAVYSETGQAVRMLGILMDISDRKRREEQLRLLEAVIVNTNDAVAITEAQPIDPLGSSIVYVNPAFTQMTGYTLEEAVGQTSGFLQGTQTDRETSDRIRVALASWQPVRADLLNYRKDGSECWVELSLVPVMNEKGKLTHWVLVQRDITDRKLAEAALQKANEELENRVAQRTAELSQANECLQRELWERKFLEEKLRTSEAQMRGVFEAMTDIVLVLKTHTSASGISEIEHINVAPTNPTSLDNITTDIIGKTVEQFFQGNRTETFLSQIRQALDAQQTINFDYSLSIGNSEVWFSACISPLSEDSFIWVARHITARKQMEEALKQSELWYRTLFESLPLLIWVADADGHRYDFNQQCQNYLGMTEEEIQRFCWEKAIHPDDVELALTPWLESLQTGTPYEAKYRLRRLDGVYRWHVERALPMYDQREQILAWIGFCTDIDDLTQAKEAMQREKEFSERLINSSVDGIFAFDRDCCYTVWNRGMERISGIGEAQIIGKSAWQVFPFLQEIGENQFMRTVLAGESVIAKDRPYHVPQTGRSGFFEAYYSPLTNESGKIIGGLGIIRDITDRKIAEAERAKLIDILEATPDFISSSSVNGRVLYFNKAARNILGLGQEAQEIGNFGISRNHPDWAYEMIRNEGIPAALRDGSWVGETALISHDGREIPLSQLIIAHKGADGSVKQISTIARDITQQKQVQATLREAERRWRCLLENVRLLVVGLDNTGKIEFANCFFLELTGYTQAEVLGKYWFETFLPLRLRQQVHTVFWEVLEQEFHPHYTNAILTKAGEERTIAWNNTLLRNLQGEAIGIMSIGEDITERHAVEQMKNEFISIVSHELRTPLTAIRGSLGILATGALNNHPQRMQRMIEIAAIDTERLVRLVNDILDLERLESGKVVLAKEYCDAAALMVQSAEAMRSLTQKQNITLSVSPISALVWASSDHIIQTLTNLLSNAIKFSPPNSTVTLSAQAQANCVLFQITDQGRGIPSDKLESIFGRFQQVDASDSRLKGGTGLGLAICRKIITQHGGRIWAESVLGEGTTFYFTLPVSPEQG